MVCRCGIVFPPRMVRDHDGFHGCLLLPDSWPRMPTAELSALWHSKFDQLVYSPLDGAVKMCEMDLTFL
jgi:hypothetical protein